MSRANPPSSGISSIDEIFMAFEPYKQRDYGSMTEYRITKVRIEETKAAINAYTTNKIIEELERLIDQQDIAWVKRGDLHSHELFVHTNLIRDRIKALNHRKEL
jgi:hypothetical protein